MSCCTGMNDLSRRGEICVDICRDYKQLVFVFRRISVSVSGGVVFSFLGVLQRDEPISFGTRHTDLEGMEEGLGDLAGPIGGSEGRGWIGCIVREPVRHRLFVILDLLWVIAAFVGEEGAIGV